MINLLNVFTNSMTALAMCILIGYILRKFNVINDNQISGFSQILMKVALPATIFISLMRVFDVSLLIESALTFLITSIIYILGGLIGKLIARLVNASERESESYTFGTAYGNVAFMGFPVIIAIFGHEGMIYAAMATASFNVLTFTVGVRIFKNAPPEAKRVKFLFKNPALLSTIIGLIFFVSGLRFPAAIENGIALLGGLTTPLSMILIGAILGRHKLKESFIDKKLILPSAARLIVIPMLSFFALYFLLPNQLMLGTIVTLMAMPAAASTAIFAEQFQSDTHAAAKIVVVSTILSMITIPLMMLIFL